MRRELHQARRAIADESRRFPAHLVQVPRTEWWPKVATSAAAGMTPPHEVWRSRHFMVQVFGAVAPAVERLTMSRVETTAQGWVDGLTWDDLQRLKAECGRGELAAVEVYPADVDVVKVANMRHLWVLAEAPAFAWRRDQ